jgi:hypothetical protein
MKIRIFAFISVLMVPAVSCLIYAWRALRKDPADSGTPTRTKLLAAAIYPAALRQILVLVSYYRVFTVTVNPSLVPRHLSGHLRIGLPFLLGFSWSVLSRLGGEARGVRYSCGP